MAGEEQLASTKGPKQSAGGAILSVVLLLLLGGGAGFGYGVLSGKPKALEEAHGASTEAKANLAASATEPGGQRSGTEGTDWRNEELVTMQPLIVRLDGSAGKWLRLDGAVAFSQASNEDRGAIVAQLGEDLMLFLGSTSLESISSPTGLEFLRDDMNDIVQSRTKGQAKRFILKSLVVE
jgi:flagellar basal body-associated protein FliL